MKINGEARLLLIMGLFVLLGGGGMVLLNRTPVGAGLVPTPPPTPVPVDWSGGRYDQLAKQGRHARGDAKARLTIIEFGDLECPSCRYAYNNYLTKIETTLPFRLVFFHFPLPMHKTAIPAAIATEAAERQGKFWSMFDALYAGEKTELTPTFIEDSARKIGLDMARFAKDSADPALEQIVRNDMKIGQGIHIIETPTFIVRDNQTGKIVEVAGSVKVNSAISQMTGTPALVLPSTQP